MTGALYPDLAPYIVRRRGAAAAMSAISTASRKTARARGYIQNYRPQQKTKALIEAADRVLCEYHAHWPLTVRQIYYRLVGAHGYPKTETFYGTLCHHLANARRARVIPFSAVRDDGVTTVEMQHFNDEEHLSATSDSSVRDTPGTSWPDRICTSRFGARRRA